MRRLSRSGCNAAALKNHRRSVGGCQQGQKQLWVPSVAPLLEKFTKNLSATSVAAAAEMAVGMGAGLLVANRLGRRTRQRVGLVALVAGLTATIPLLIGAGVRVNRELGEGRLTRRRLETIRHDHGFPDDGDFY